MRRAISQCSRSAVREPFPFVEFGDSTQSRPGDWVVAIGNPFGLGGTVTSGIVSAVYRNTGQGGAYDRYIQTDAAINRGNSGGPLFDMQGNVIGINNAIFSPSGGSVGIGFAIPAEIAAPIVQKLRDGVEIERGYLGVSIQPVDGDRPMRAAPSRRTAANSSRASSPAKPPSRRASAPAISSPRSTGRRSRPTRPCPSSWPTSRRALPFRSNWSATAFDPPRHG